jgi:hypothetical protein
MTMTEVFLVSFSFVFLVRVEMTKLCQSGVLELANIRLEKRSTGLKFKTIRWAISSCCRFPQALTVE